MKTPVFQFIYTKYYEYIEGATDIESHLKKEDNLIINQVNPSHSSANYFNRLFEGPYFVMCVRNRWNEKKVDLLNYINNRKTMLADEIRPAAERNFERWPILGIQSWKDADGYEDRRTYDDEVKYLITWLNRRYEWLDKEINEIIE